MEGKHFRPTGPLLALGLLGGLPGIVQAASDSQPHYHRGKLTPYQIGPPSLLLSGRDEEKLRAGRPVMQALVAEDGLTRRLIMVQDIPVPSSVVLGRIMDLDAYDHMVSGVDSCVTYASNGESGGVKSVKSAYEISAMGMKFKYFVEHLYDPKAQCMVFRLDYGKRSDLDDTVGYWYVDNRGRTSCRVYYSLTKEALKKATLWVSHEAIKEWRSSRTHPLVAFVGNVRESLRESLGNLQLPQQPRWIEEGKEHAVLFVSALRAQQKSKRTNMVEYS